MSDFVLEISGGDGDYQLKVDSPAGEAHRTALGIEVSPERMMALQSHVLASASSRRAATSELEREVRTMGEDLFRCSSSRVLRPACTLPVVSTPKRPVSLCGWCFASTLPN